MGWLAFLGWLFEVFFVGVLIVYYEEVYYREGKGFVFCILVYMIREGFVFLFVV